MPELDSITIKGFKSIASVEKLPLRATNVVIGPNGSGKSNFIGVFSFLHEIRVGRLTEYVAKAGGADKVLHFGSKATQRLQVQISFENRTCHYFVMLEPTAADGLQTTHEIAVGPPQTSDGAHPPFDILMWESGKESVLNEPKFADYVHARLDSWRVYHFHDTSFSSPMKKTTDINDNRYLRPDGSNLAPFLYYLQQKHQTSYSLIRRVVQRVAPFFDDFQLEPQKLNPDKIRLEWRHKGTDAYFDASSFSDGTLRFIALAVLFLQPDEFRPSVILVDEPELGLHPYAITMLASLVKQASAKTQVIVSTQSPCLVDHFEPEDVLVADRVEGGTQFTRLKSEELATWLEDYSLGQLWEKNEIGGRPVAE